MAAAKFYQQSVDQVIQTLQTDLAAGLTSTEARGRWQRYGPNALASRRRISPLAIFFGQFKDVLIVILLLAAVVSLGLGLAEENGSLTEGVLIFVIVLAIAVVGFFNEFKAEKTVEALKRLVAQKARVRRGGEEVEVDAKELVPGDVVLLEEGQKVPADIRLVSVIGLRAAEASLTGESAPVDKKLTVITRDVTVGDQVNMLFSGTVITAGKGEGVVVATGAATQIGQIAKLVDEAEEDPTPMQRKLDRLGKQLGVGVLAICVLVFVVIFFLDKEFADVGLAQRLLLALTAAVALAVAAIPEGLAFVVRISLALGARRMAARQALVRRLSAVEALGSTDIICSDKTGTLTKGEMTVREVWTNRTCYQVTGTGYGSGGEFQRDGRAVSKQDDLELILRLGGLCNNSRLKDDLVIGDPTEGALLVAAEKAGLPVAAWSESHPRVMEVPFTSDRKMMSTLHRSGDGYVVAAKGAAEVVLARCDRIWLDGRPRPLTAAVKQDILEQNHRLSSQALRVLGLAYKEVAAKPKTPGEIESKLVFVGLQGMMDPPRREIKEVIAAVTRGAGMRVAMITGDYIETAKAVAAEIGLEGEAISGSELDRLSQAEFEKRVESIVIYARVNPEHKIRIVQALKQHGHQVAMTGDGVNDAPAIKAADIGIAMGAGGTDVAKEASAVILLDDQFLTIVGAVEEGRGIFDNVRKFVNYLLSANIAEVITVLFGLLLFNDLVLTAAQLLFINIVTDGLPAVALGSDPAARGIMSLKPGRFQGAIITKKLWLEMTIFGALMSIAVLSQFALNLQTGGMTAAVSGAFAAMVVLEMVRLAGIRSDYAVSWRSNPWLLVAIASSLALLAAVLYVPLVGRAFAVQPPSAFDWLFIAWSGTFLFGAMKLVRRGLNRWIPEGPQPGALPAGELG
ncbi:cation-translocating P-type ATPase [Candidatus Parcubacteria bacterium]|nr:cation-translocating P-type ATPase [Candidatus Parcubacteria bacterium]